MIHERLWYALIYVAEALIAWQFFGSLFLSKGKFWSRVALYGAGYTVAYLAFAASSVWLNTAFFCILQPNYFDDGVPGYVEKKLCFTPYSSQVLC